VQSVGGTPFENLIVDFTEMLFTRGCKYLLVFVCIFSGWVKAFPGSGQVSVKGNHPLVQNTCVYGIGQWAGLHG
jgi:hypothetical protein